MEFQMPRKIPTLKEISSITGVSSSIVSACLNGHEERRRIPGSTSDKVKKVAAELGYRPQAHAKLLRAGSRSGAIGLVQATGHRMNFLSHNCLRGMHEELLANDLPLISGTIPDDKLVSVESFPKILREWVADGLLINYLNRYPLEFIEILRKFRVPTIWMNVKHEVDCVHPDDFGGARTATESLLKLGHRRIAFLAFGNPSHYSYKDRLDGYLAALRSASSEPEIVSLGREGPKKLPSQNCIAAVRAWLSSRFDKPSAIITCYGEGDLVMAAALEMGIKVPEDLSIISFASVDADDPGILTSHMLIPFFELGRTSVRTLLEKMENPDSPIPAKTVPYPPLIMGTIAHPPL